MTKDFLKCLKEFDHAVTLADQVREKLTQEIDTESTQNENTIEKRLSFLTDRLISYDHEDEIDMIGSVMLDGDHVTYVSVLNCQAVSFKSNLPCTRTRKHFGIVRDFILFGDSHLRWYAIDESAKEDNTTYLGISNLGVKDPRNSMWYERALEGPKEGVWSRYMDYMHESVLTTFSKTFQSTGNSVDPGPGGGGVVYVSVNARKICPDMLM